MSIHYYSDVTHASHTLEPRALYIKFFLSTVIANFTKEHLLSLLEHRYSSKKLRRKLKCAWGLAKMPYYIDLGGKAKRFAAIYNGKRWYVAVKRARYHSIPRRYTAVPHSIPPEYRAWLSSKLAVKWDLAPICTNDSRMKSASHAMHGNCQLALASAINSLHGPRWYQDRDFRIPYTLKCSRWI